MPDNEENTSILDVRNVCVSYGKFVAVANVSFTVPRGVIYGVIGPNGAGKSSLMKVLSGQCHARTGRILFRGRDITHKSPQERRRLGLSRSFQTSRIFPDLSVRDQLILASQALGRSRYRLYDEFGADPASNRDASDVISLLNIKDLSDVAGRNLSYADQRRLEVGLALVGSPDLLLLDEPSSGMSRDESQAFAALLHKVHEETGDTVVAVEHDLEVVQQIADEVLVMHQGSLLLQGNAQAVMSDPQVRKVYLGV